MEFVDNFEPDTYLTLATNTQMSITGFRLKLKDFFGHLDRAYLGPRWSKMPFNKRTDGIGFIEKEDSNIHSHFELRTPAKAYLCNIALNAEKYWGEICPSGSYDVQMIGGRRALTGYNTKEHKRQDYDWHNQVILLRDFAS